MGSLAPPSVRHSLWRGECSQKGIDSPLLKFVGPGTVEVERALFFLPKDTSHLAVTELA